MKRSTHWRDRRFGRAPRGEGRADNHRRKAVPAESVTCGASATSQAHVSASAYPSERQPLQGFDYSFGAVG